MKTRQILDLISGMPEGAITTNENRFDFKYLLSLLDEARAAWIQQVYMQDKRLAPILYQKYYPDYSQPLQPGEKCYAKFLMPDIVRLDEHSDGLRYVGYDDGEGGVANNFQRIVSRATLASYANHPVMNPYNERTYSFLYDGASGILELYGKGRFIRKPPLIEAVFKHPTEVPSFNLDHDDYPLTMDGINAVTNMIFAADTRISEQTAPKPAFTVSQSIPKK